jgi:hypothetical protein
VDNAGFTALAYLRYAEYRPTVIVQFDYVAMLYTAGLSVLWMYSGYPIAVTVFLNAMPGYFC